MNNFDKFFIAVYVFLGASHLFNLIPPSNFMEGILWIMIAFNSYQIKKGMY